MENYSEDILESDKFRLSEKMLLALVDDLMIHKPGSVNLSEGTHHWLLSGLQMFLAGAPLEAGLGISTQRGLSKLATRVKQHRKNSLIQRAAESIHDIQDHWSKAKRIAVLLNDTEALKQAKDEIEKLLLEAFEIDCHLPTTPEAIFKILTK